MSLWCESSGSGPDLLLLHGWGMNAGVWQPLLDRLRVRYRVSLLELPGHGASPSLPDGDLDAWCEACLQAAPQSAVWVGWSLGGLLAQRSALIAPERISHLGLVAATPRFVRQADWPDGMAEGNFEQFSVALQQDASGTLKRFIGLQVRGVAGERELLREMNQALSGRQQAQPAALRAGLELLLKTDMRASINGLQVPSSWLFGARDTLVRAGTASAVQKLLPSAQCRLVGGAGHAPQLSHPQLFLDWLESCFV